MSLQTSDDIMPAVTLRSDVVCELMEERHAGLTVSYC